MIDCIICSVLIITNNKNMNKVQKVLIKHYKKMKMRVRVKNILNINQCWLKKLKKLKKLKNKDIVVF